MNPNAGYPHTPGVKSTVDTTVAAATSMADSAPKLRMRVLARFAGGAEFTADEVAAAMGASLLSIRPRVAELHRLGLLVDSGKRRHNDSGRAAAVWRARREGE